MHSIPHDLPRSKDHNLLPVNSGFLRLGGDEVLASTFFFGKRQKEGIVLERRDFRKGPILKAEDFGILEGVNASEKHFYDSVVLPQTPYTDAVLQKISPVPLAWVAGGRAGTSRLVTYPQSSGCHKPP